jgi:polar amino acid transport system permease protein
MGNWQRLVWNQRDALLSGLVVTVEICVIAFACAIVIGLVLCLIRMYVRPLRFLAIGLIEFFRATPILVQLLWVNYVWPAFRMAGFFFPRPGWRWRYVRRLPGGDFSRRDRSDTARSRELPIRSACRRCSSPAGCTATVALSTAPSLVNQFTVIAKSSTLVSVITVQDIMFQSQKIVNIWYEPIQILCDGCLSASPSSFLVFRGGQDIG